MGSLERPINNTHIHTPFARFSRPAQNTLSLSLSLSLSLKSITLNRLVTNTQLLAYLKFLFIPYFVKQVIKNKCFKCFSQDYVHM